MVDPLVWVLAGVLLYSVVATLLSARGLLPDAIRVSGPITTLHTKRGKAFLNRLARAKRFWRAWSNVGLGLALVVMAGSFVMLLFSAMAIFEQPDTATIRQPQNALAIPGVSDFLPLSVAPEIVFGLLVGMVVHEGGHGLLCRVEDIEVDSMGLALFTLIPIGAFVQPDEEGSQRADRGAQSRMFAAGVTNNFVVTALAFALLMGPVAGSIAVAPGVPVEGALPDSPADEAGIGYGDVITEIDGQPVANGSELDAALAGANGTVAVGLGNGSTIDVERSPIVSQTAGNNPPVTIGATVTAVNGTAIDTEAEFHAALADRTVARLGTDQENVTIPVGARVVASEDDPLNESGAPTGESVTIIRAAGQRTPNATALSDALGDTRPDDEITVEAFVRGERESYAVTLDENENTDENDGFLGVFIQGGTNGITVNDFGIEPYPADQYLGVLGGGPLGGGSGGSILTQLVTLLILPLASVQGIGPNFSGFTGPIVDFYTTTGPLGFLGGGVFALANVLFWTGWINVQLGFFNCIPAFPLDGGHLLRSSTEAVVSRLPVDNRRLLTRTVTTTVGVTMLGAFVLVIFGPQLLTG